MAIIQNINVSTPNDGLGDTLRDSQIKANSNFSELNAKKVEAEVGKGLSENDFTDADKAKLDSIDTGAMVNVQADLDQTDTLAADFVKGKKNYFHSIGSFRYQDLAGQTTAQSITANTDTYLLNDSDGTKTNLSTPPYGVTTVYDAPNNQFDFTELSIGDTLTLRVDMEVTTTTANQVFEVDLQLGIGGTNEETKYFAFEEVKAAGVYDFSFSIPFDIANADVNGLPAKLIFRSDASASVKNLNYYTEVILKDINIVSPVGFEECVKKAESDYYTYDGGHILGFVGTEGVVIPTDSQNIELTGNIDAISNFQYTTDNIYQGANFRIRNAQAVDITIKHQTSGPGYRPQFSNLADFVLQPNESIEFSFKKTADNTGLLYHIGAATSGGGGSGDLQDVTEEGNTTTLPLIVGIDTDNIAYDRDRLRITAMATTPYDVFFPAPGLPGDDVGLVSGELLDQELGLKEDVFNKKTSIAGVEASDTAYLSAKATYDYFAEHRHPVADTNYTITGTDNQIIALTSITADRTITLPAASFANQHITITDESGLCSNSRRIIVMPSGGDVIGGDSFAVINFPNGTGVLASNGSGKWNILSTTAIQFSAGVNTMPTITDNGDGTVTVGTGVYALYANTNGTGRPKAYQVAGGTFSLTDQASNWIIATYNTTTGVVSVSSVSASTSINNITVIPIFKIFRDGVTLHIGNYDTLGLALSNKMQRSFEKTEPYRFEVGGVLIGESATRIITISSGNIWSGGNEIPLTAVASNTHTCYQFVNTSGTWSKSVVTQYNNTQYNAVGGLVTLGNTNSYAVNYVFRSVGTDTDFAFVLGTGDYTLGQAQTAPIPSNLPTFITEHMVFVGRIIVQKNINTAAQIDSANTTGALFTTAGVTDHEALNNLLGGAANDHYHLTLAQHTIATKPAGSIIKTRKDVSTTTYTLLSADVDKILYLTNASGCTVTVPSGLTINQEYEFIQYAAGQVSFVTSGTTLRYPSYAIATTFEQYSRVLLSYIDTETYSLFGDLSMI